MEIDEDHLLELIFWARRYCDERSTYAPTRFNWLYYHIMSKYPDMRSRDNFDSTLKDRGKYWPYAQDGMFSEETGAFDARYSGPKMIEKDTSDGK